VTALLIDLDRPEPPEEPRPMPRWAASGVFRRALLLLPLLLVLPLTASAVPAPPRYGSPLVIPFQVGEDMHVSRTGIFVAEPGGAAVRAYAFDGTLRWRATVPRNYRIYTVAAGAVFLMSQTPPSRVIFLDETTGAVRWEDDRRVLAVGDGAVIFDEDEASVELERVTVAGRMVARRWSDGAVLWRIDEKRRQLFHAFGWDRSTGLILADGDKAEFVEPETGARLPLHDWPGSGADYAVEMAFLVHGLLIAVVGDRFEPKAIAFDLQQGRPLWTVPIAWGDVGYVSGCGPMVCLPDDGAGTMAVDPRSGEVVSRYPFSMVYTGPPGRLVGDRMIIGNGRVGSMLLDAATGRVIRRADGWAVIGPLNAETIPMFRWNPSTPTRVALLDTADGRTHLLDAHPPIDGIDSGQPCGATGMHLVCRARGTGLLIWRYATHLPPATK
jgi:hypothetical protein